MYGKKKTSLGSQPTQPQPRKRFIRRNSYCSLTCRSSSLKKLADTDKDLADSSRNPQLFTPSAKMQTESQKFFKNEQDNFQPSVKRCSGSMKLDIFRRKEGCLQAGEAEGVQVVERERAGDEVEALRSQCKKLKIYFNQQRQKRKILQDQLRLNKVELKRLQRRLQKHMNEKEQLASQREDMLQHIELLESKHFDQPTQLLHSYKLKFLEDEVARLRKELAKSKSAREGELLRQVERMMEEKYGLEKELRAALVGKESLTRQLEELDQELEEVRVGAHQKVIRSVEYIELRERYKMVLVECKELKEEMEHIQRLRSMDSSSRIDHTLLTMSVDSLTLQ